MKITLLADDRVRYEPTPGPMTIEAPRADAEYSPFHMLGSSLAACTFSVLHAWASRAGIPTEDLALEASWTFAEKPHRVERLALDIVWPSLPASRLEAARRAAALCTVHVTLEHPPELPLTISRGTDTPAEPRADGQAEAPAEAPRPVAAAVGPADSAPTRAAAPASPPVADAARDVTAVAGGAA